MSGAHTLGRAPVNIEVPQRAGIRNRLLVKLAPADWALLAPHLEAVTMRERQVIEVPHKPITHAYLLEIGVASVVAVDNEDHRIEVGVIGFEGITGVSLIMGDTLAQHSTYMQIPGSGHRIATDKLRSAIGESESLRALMLKSAHGFMIQTAQTALANGRAKLEERLARWLLMAHDRMTSNAVPLTHEFLAVMLGVRRAGVTVAIHSFEQRGFVTTRRGELTMVDRPGLEKVAGSFYGTPEVELDRLLRAA